MGRIGTIAVFAVLAALVAGCTSSSADPSSSPAPSSPRSSSNAVAASTPPAPTRTGPLTTGPGVQPGEKPPVLSAEASQHTPAGALAFAEYYIKALDWTIATNDAYLLKEISGPTCSACERDINAVAVLRRLGTRETGGRLKIISSKPPAVRRW